MTKLDLGRRRTIRAAYALAASSLVAAPAFAARSTSNTSGIPASLQHLDNKSFQGGIALVNLGESSHSPKAFFNGTRVLVLRPNQSSQWWSIVGIALSTPVGDHSLQVQHGSQEARTFKIKVLPKDYPKQHITLKNKEYVNPPAKTLERIENELKLQTKAYKTFTETTPSNLLFDAPAPGRFSSPFGYQRIFNGEPRNPHAGLDIAAPTGTPVKSPAAGKVLLVGDFFFNGKTIFIDHGMGLISMFCHLSQIDKTAGDEVKRSEVVAKVGSTGRATGPHLHWNLSLNDARVDPKLFLRKQG